MSSKENKTFHEILKQFLRITKSNSGTIKNRNDINLTEDIIKDISPGSSLTQRTKTIYELCDKLVKNKFEEQDISKLYACVEDLLNDPQSRENRHLAYTFLICICRYQFERLDVLRVRFFKLIQNSRYLDDIIQRFELLQALTNNGKNINNFEEEIGSFLLQWITDITRAGKTLEFLSLLVNVIKFNPAYIDEEIITGLVAHVCNFCCNTVNHKEIVLECLQVLDTIVCYSILPNESLPTFIAALCRTVNHEAYCQTSWKIMRNLLGTHLGHASLLTMCRALQEPVLSNDPELLRGAVFHVNMGLWGRHRVTSLKCSPTAILPSFLHALKCNHPLVMYEVMLSIQMLINKNGHELEDPTWDSILNIIEAIIQYNETSTKSNSNSQVAIHLHETLCNIEQLIEIDAFKGSIERIYELIERCALMRPETSVLGLISYLAQEIVPTQHKWLCKLNKLLEKYFKHETRTNIRVKVLNILENVIKLNRNIYEDELMERIVVVHLQNIMNDPDIIVKETATNLLANLCIDCESKRCLELLDILDKILKHPFEMYGETTTSPSDIDLLDVKAAVLGLIKAFTVKIYQLPSSHAIKIYEMLVTHLEMHYSRPHVFENCNIIRLKIFEMFLKIRANAAYHIGYPDTTSSVIVKNRTVIRYSPYISIDCSKTCNTSVNTNSPPPGSPANLMTQQTQPPPLQHNFITSSHITHVSLKRGFKCFITCLTQEKDWEVLQLILKELPKVLENKTLILSRHGSNDIDLLATALYNMIADKSLGLPETLRNTSTKITKHDFYSDVLPVLGCLASYHNYLESTIQKKIVLSLTKSGLQSRCSRQCITALTTCTLEMRDVMVKLLPEVLLDLSKISTTQHIASPILEFLSTLTRLPDVFSSFVGDQYMSVFAISLPYTNPFKFNHYIVSLAHHVIAVWFLKCRLPFRRDFVNYITKGLKTNIIVPFEEGQLFKPEFSLNEDSSNRKRSSSLTEPRTESRGRRERHNAMASASQRAALDLRPPLDESLSTFHTELTETCIDFMARYTFSPCSALPKRLPTAEFLLSGGQALTWLLGNMLITITTSGCSTKALKNGLCDKCWSVCKSDSSIGTPDTDNDSKRNSKSNFNRSTSGEDSQQSNRITRQNSNELQKSSQVSPVEEKREIVAPTTTTAPTSVLTSNMESLEQQLPNKLHQLIGSEPKYTTERTICSCWCQGWAEICVRRPTGDISWVVRVQNQITNQNMNSEFPLNELSTLYLPSLERHRDENKDIQLTTRTTSAESDIEKSIERYVPFKTNSTSVPVNIPGSPMKQSPSRQNSRESVDEDFDGDIYDDNLKTRNPVRRSNSSPEMSTNWKNPFLTQDKIDKMIVYSNENDREMTEISQKKSKSNYCKDMRVSCEAIPEEISGLGTTPPSNEATDTSALQLHSYHSYPGTTVPSTDVDVNKTSATVPTSPITLNATTLSQNKLKPSGKEITSTDNRNTSYIRPKNLPVSNQQLTTKPPQSPTQTSPKLQRNMSLDKDTTSNKNTTLIRSNTLEKQTSVDISSMPIRSRGHTISVMSQVRKPPRIRRANSPRAKDVPKSGVNPSFVFLQLYHSATFGMNEKPLLVGQSQAVQRSLQLLDKIPPYEIHKVGVLYVGPGQCNNQVAILKNKYGSLRYVRFLQKLGTMIRLQDVDPQVWIGGLEQNGNDGKFAYMWNDDVMHMMFHVATLMPNQENDPLCNEKIKHIGNDFVTIVYNESGEEYDMKTIKTNFNFSCIVIEPLDYGTNRVTVQTRLDLAEHIGHGEAKIISDENLSILTRQLALHANLASMISNSLKSSHGNVYASNWLERLRHIKRLRNKILQEVADTKEKDVSNGNNNTSEFESSTKKAVNKIYIDDFTEYT